ncbi:MAG: glycosyltransferase, partial [Candidatus Rokubacteria bacterium]|nr:glycosyltransferase [Candidatus Rokubacteria bacterium]
MADATARTLVSIVAPVYNEEHVIAAFVARLVATVMSIQRDYEFEI